MNLRAFLLYDRSMDEATWWRTYSFVESLPMEPPAQLPSPRLPAYPFLRMLEPADMQRAWGPQMPAVSAGGNAWDFNATTDMGFNTSISPASQASETEKTQII
jgi:hypothetical protein